MGKTPDDLTEVAYVRATIGKRKLLLYPPYNPSLGATPYRLQFRNTLKKAIAVDINRHRVIKTAAELPALVFLLQLEYEDFRIL